MPFRLHLRLPLIVLLTLLLAPAAWSGARAQEAPSPFTVMPAAGGSTIVAAQEVTFAVIAPQPGVLYTWQFGDGSQPNAGPKVTHTFTSVEDYTVQLSAQTGGAPSVIGSQVVRVAPELRGVFASDIDGQFTPADLIQMVAVVRAPGLTGVGVRTAGTLIGERTAQYNISGGEDWLLLSDMRVADERNAIIREELLKKPGGKVPLDRAAFTLALDYTTTSGKQVSVSYSPPVRDFFQPDQVVALTYPDIKGFAGLPPEGPGNDNYYLRGDADFNHLDDWYVRRLALEWGRRGGAWPDDPQVVATNIFQAIDALFGDGEPGDFNNDYNISRLFADGTLSTTRKNGEYICIAQAYLLGAMGRALGFPAREINNAIGKPNYQRPDGVWVVTWWQEAGLELWYNGDWHYFDTWLGVTDRKAYLQRNLIYQSWSAFDRQATEFRTVKGEPTGLKGHNFNAWPGDPPQWSFIEEVVRPDIVVEGMVGEPPASTITRMDEAIALGIGPVAAGIRALPVAARPEADVLIAGQAP